MYKLIVLATIFISSFAQDKHQFLVKFKNGKNGDDVIQSAQGEHVGSIDKIGVKIIRIPHHAAAVGLLRLINSPDVEFAETDVKLPASFVPNDSGYVSQWYHRKMQSEFAWDLSTGTNNVIIAILDTGVYNHPDFAGHLVPGWNMYDNDINTDDVYGHGTAVAGCAAAVGNNGLGVAGMVWQCKIMPVRISQPDGYASFSTIANGLLWAADHGARVANISYGVTGSSSVQSAAKYFMDKGGVVVNSAGNETTVLAYANNPYLVTVSATDSADVLASFSNTGTAVDLGAPGVNIYTTTRDGGYGAWNGTSFSSPLVAGVAALVISANPVLSAYQVVEILKSSADDVGVVGWDPSYGSGRVNAQKAVALAKQVVVPVPVPTPVPAPEPTPTPTPTTKPIKGRGHR